VKKFPTVREALLYEKLEEKGVKCNTCARYCIIPEGKVGFCGTRKNIEGKLYTLVYGDVGLHISPNPIEKKPFYHFWPGSYALTLGTWRCNFTCPWCCNFEMSKARDRPNPEKSVKEGAYVSPEKLIELVKKYNCQGVSISFNEPTLLLEYSLDVFDLAKKSYFELNGKKYPYTCTYVTNGYMSPQALDELIKHKMDAANVDIKGDAATHKKYCAPDVEVVWSNAEEMVKKGVHVELTFLTIPGINDSKERFEKDFKRIADEIGTKIPVHITAYSSFYEIIRGVEPISYDTPVEILERAYQIAKNAGLEYVYIGNVPGHPYENTYCPSCGELLIERYGFSVTKYLITPKKRCPKCDEKIPIIGEYVPSASQLFYF
jgi:pyruvate formate lyase activating enzyme